MLFRRDLSMQRKTAKKEAWQPKCAAPRLVYHSALFVQHIYARIRTYQGITYNQLYSAKKKKHPPEVRSRDGHVKHVRKSSRSVKKGVYVWTFVRKTCVFYAVACNYLLLV